MISIARYSHPFEAEHPCLRSLLLFVSCVYFTNTYFSVLDTVSARPFLYTPTPFTRCPCFFLPYMLSLFGRPSTGINSLMAYDLLPSIMYWVLLFGRVFRVFNDSDVFSVSFLPILY